jgi:hypothetical protein
VRFIIQSSFFGFSSSSSPGLLALFLYILAQEGTRKMIAVAFSPSAALPIFTRP